MLMTAMRPPPVGADSGGGGITAPAFGTATSFSNSDESADGASVEYTFSHTHTAGSDPGLLLCVAVKGSTDAVATTYTLDKVAYNGTSILSGKIGESSTRLFGTAPSVIAFVTTSPSTGSNDVEFDITAPVGQTIQCIAAVAIDLSSFSEAGSGLDSDSSASSATSQSISVTTGQANSRVFGITAARAHANGGNITATTSGYSEIVDFGTSFSSSTDIGFAVHTLIKASAGAQAYASSWPNSAAFGSLGFELEGV